MWRHSKSIVMGIYLTKSNASTANATLVNGRFTNLFESSSGIYRIAMAFGRVLVFVFDEWGCGQGGMRIWREYSGLVLCHSGQKVQFRLIRARTISYSINPYGRDLLAGLRGWAESTKWHIREETLVNVCDISATMISPDEVFLSRENLILRKRPIQTMPTQLVPHWFPSRRFDWAVWALLIKFFFS